jgi:hypothetical protein
MKRLKDILSSSRITLTEYKTVNDNYKKLNDHSINKISIYLTKIIDEKKESRLFLSFSSGFRNHSQVSWLIRLHSHTCFFCAKPVFVSPFSFLGLDLVQYIRRNSWRRFNTRSRTNFGRTDRGGRIVLCGNIGLFTGLIS